ncbi:MAG: major facilitator family protein MmrA [Pseudomonadota bacterium]|jgi:predicted MFS family arabinose efflux permease
MRPKIEQQRPAPASVRLTSEETKLVLLLAMVQFVNILDFMMVMPLGPDFSAELGIPTSKIGIIGGSYTAAAALSGIVSAFFLDRFPRKKALATALAGLSIATVAGGISTGLATLLAARVTAGMFGGPATALALAMTADCIPVRKRGRALGIVMGAFSIASILGVPAGLELAAAGSWRTPFFAVGCLGAFVTAAIRLLLRPERMPSTTPAKAARLVSGSRQNLQALQHLLRQASTHMSMALGASVMFSGFIVIPNIAAFVQKNLGFPRAHMGLLYLCGGIASLLSMQIAGRLTDRYGATRISAAGTILILFTLTTGFYRHADWFNPVLIAVFFMAGTSIRAISYNTISSQVPSQDNRGAFMSLQSTTQHFASATGSFVSSLLLTSDSEGKLTGMPLVAMISMAVSLLVPVLTWHLESRLRMADKTL